MLAELMEEDATGEIAQIYKEIRETCAVPYVSTLQRHMATCPGWLEWTWAATRPAFLDGSAPAAAWDAAAKVEVEPLPKLSRSALRVLGVDAAGERSIRAVADLFIRVSPTNLMLSGLLRMLLAGQRPDGHGPERLAQAANAPSPKPLPPLPSIIHPDELTGDVRAVLMQFGADVGGQPFVPGLYRMLGHWPGYLAHLATVLVPRFDHAATKASCTDLLARIDATVPDVFAKLPELPAMPPIPPAGEFDYMITATDRYRETSPEMVVFGTLIRDALPPPE
ncbi:MAG: hypothetical protein JXQ99_22140 [Hyphomicrobiaceae bacterium]